MGIVVYFGQQLLKEMKCFPRADLEKINTFVQHVSHHGFSNLPGRNKSSDEVPFDSHCWLDKVRYAQLHHLWHYHIGIPKYNDGEVYGNLTSQYLLHYVKGDGYIKIVDFSAHPPFRLPSEQYLADSESSDS